ncbi:MAG TPA: hypothetical protein PLR52_02025 [Bacteroidales bacterium]|nr:hypothetical protein [Bacteroidales bacterium]HPI68497.1 hypothetical protein [Bacteroidales bacterium]HPR72786.1 hypothetical protein [Bacteroidales bacterium]
MNKIIPLIIILLLSAACRDNVKNSKRIAVARAGNSVLYLDQIPPIIQPGTSSADSLSIIKNYINRWAKKELLFQKAEENLTSEYRDDINRQLEEARADLVIYHYQRQMMYERMDTVINDSELEDYYNANQASLMLQSNIVKALFIKIPVETPNTGRIRSLARSTKQDDLQELETLCYQFAEKFDDFNEDWIPLDMISVELPQEINNQESFLRRTTFFETSDSEFLYFVVIRDYKLRSSLAPLEYVKDDIRRMIWNLRRIEFIQSLENGIYNDAVRNNIFRIYN